MVRDLSEAREGDRTVLQLSLDVWGNNDYRYQVTYDNFFWVPEFWPWPSADASFPDGPFRTRVILSHRWQPRRLPRSLSPMAQSPSIRILMHLRAHMLCTILTSIPGQGEKRYMSSRCQTLTHQRSFSIGRGSSTKTALSSAPSHLSLAWCARREWRV